MSATEDSIAASEAAKRRITAELDQLEAELMGAGQVSVEVACQRIDEVAEAFDRELGVEPSTEPTVFDYARMWAEREGLDGRKK